MEIDLIEQFSSAAVQFRAICHVNRFSIQDLNVRKKIMPLFRTHKTIRLNRNKDEYHAKSLFIVNRFQ